jgi:hypothetical protein
MTTTAQARSTELFLYPPPFDGPRRPGCCRWCGDPIELVDPGDYRRRARTIHRGDEHEAGDRDCRGEYLGSSTWDARYAVRWAARARGEVHLACVDCGVVVEEMTDAGRRQTERHAGNIIYWRGLQTAVVYPPDPRVPPGGRAVTVATGVPGWEAEHEVPIIDGGEHVLANLRCRCVPCHRAKTTREAVERAARRRRAPRPARQLQLAVAVLADDGVAADDLVAVGAHARLPADGDPDDVDGERQEREPGEYLPHLEVR